FPEELEYNGEIGHSINVQKEYYSALQAAKDSAIEVQLDFVTGDLLSGHLPKPCQLDSIHHLPSGWRVEVGEVLDSVSSGASPFGSVSNYKKVAVLIPPPTSEQARCSFKDQCDATSTTYKEQFCGCYNDEARLKSEQKEESQEEIFNDLFSQYFKMLHERNSWSYTGEVLREKFTITRRK